jgi:hypothetical protein
MKKVRPMYWKRIPHLEDGGQILSRWSTIFRGAELRDRCRCDDVRAQQALRASEGGRGVSHARPILRITLGQNLATERGEFVKKVLRRIFRAEGKTYSARAMATPEGYLSSSWSTEQRDAFQDWLTTALVRTRRLRTGEARFKASMFLLWHGWKVHEPDHTGRPERSRESRAKADGNRDPRARRHEEKPANGTRGESCRARESRGRRSRVWINNLCIRN